MYKDKSQNNRKQYGKPHESDLEEKVVQVKRVSKKTKGGNTIGFSVLTVTGDKKGKVGVGIGKGLDVASSIRKSLSYAHKHQIIIPLKGNTIPHAITWKYGAAKVMLKPAPVGAGLVAGGSVRAVLAAAGVRDVVAKMIGSRNAVTNAYCVMEALGNLKTDDGKQMTEIEGGSRKGGD
jgi:small subunit ribosomal protein S5